MTIDSTIHSFSYPTDVLRRWWLNRILDSKERTSKVLTLTWSCSPAYSMLWKMVQVYRLRTSIRAKYLRYHRCISMAAFIAVRRTKNDDENELNFIQFSINIKYCMYLYYNNGHRCDERFVPKTRIVRLICRQNDSIRRRTQRTKLPKRLTLVAKDVMYVE